MKQESRRVRMTRKLLNDSLLECLQHKLPDKVTVTEICRRADVNRTTYYNYYSDPLQQYDALMESVVGEFSDVIRKAQRSHTLSLEKLNVYVSELMELAEKHIGMIRTFNRISGVQFWEKLSIPAIYFLQGLGSEQEEAEIERSTFAFSGIYALLLRWISQEKPADRSMLEQNITHMLRALYQAAD